MPHIHIYTYTYTCHARGHYSHLIFCDLQDTMPCRRSLLSSLIYPTQPVPREAEDFHRDGKYFTHVFLLT